MKFGEHETVIFKIILSQLLYNINEMAKIILLDTIYLPKFLQSCFYSIVCTLKYYIF